jgi:ATP-dependent Clp protease protease subunit
MIHKLASSYYDGQVGECIMEVKEILKLHDYITKVYVQRTSQPQWIISEDMERVVFMSTKKQKFMVLLIL